MKNLLVILVLIVTCMSCNKSPIIDGKVPFVVDRVELTREVGYSKYTSVGKDEVICSGWSASHNAELIAPTGSFKQGDTITFNKSLYY